MESDVITIDKKELKKLVKEMIREELKEIKYVSDKEQRELEEIFGESLFKEDYNPDDCIRL